MEDLEVMEEILIRELTKEEEKALDDAFEEIWESIK